MMVMIFGLLRQISILWKRTKKRRERKINSMVEGAIRSSDSTSCVTGVHLNRVGDDSPREVSEVCAIADLSPWSSECGLSGIPRPIELQTIDLGYSKTRRRNRLCQI